jgi:hypothetical protein
VRLGDFFVKSFAFARALPLTATNLRVISLPEMLRGKRVAIVGPASSAYGTNQGGFIDGCDFVIRVNKSAYTVNSGKFAEDIGTRTDILFHSFFENESSGGGRIDIPMYRAQGIRYLVNPRNTWAGLRNTLNFYKKYLVCETTYTLPKQLYATISAPLLPHRPTVGLTALLATMECEFRELYITGFTFYKTPFGSGYRDQIQDAKKAKQFINEQGVHNIDKEFETFRKFMNKHQAKRIKLDGVLSAILEDVEAGL